MPCYYTGSAEGDARYAAEQANDLANRYRKELDKLTDLLCKAGKCYERGTPAPKELRDWWQKHKKEDAKRGEPW